jgi:GNAT superfamily N-acetyltransferase
MSKLSFIVYTHPITLAVWVVLGSALDYYAGWVPSETPLSSVSLLMGFAIVALPFLVTVEYLHRPTFTRLMRKTLGAPDLVAIERYYGQEKGSGCLVFDRKGEVGGVICWDGSRGGMDLGTVLGAEEGEVKEEDGMADAILTRNTPTGVGSRVRNEGLRQRKGKGKDSSGVVEIRHLDVDHPYRNKGIATELLYAALEETFGRDSTEMVVVQTNPMAVEGLFTKFGFVPATDAYPRLETVGLLGWQGRWLQVDRQAWDSKRLTIFSK